MKPIALSQHKKSSEKIRRDFLSRLTYNRIWLTPSQKPRWYETAIIFDWDDTLLCTSFINPTGVFNPNTPILPAVYQQLAVLEECAVNVLKLSIQYGTTVLN